MAHTIAIQYVLYVLLSFQNPWSDDNFSMQRTEPQRRRQPVPSTGFEETKAINLLNISGDIT